MCPNSTALYLIRWTNKAFQIYFSNWSLLEKLPIRQGIQFENRYTAKYRGFESDLSIIRMALASLKNGPVYTHSLSRSHAVVLYMAALYPFEQTPLHVSVRGCSRFHGLPADLPPSTMYTPPVQKLLSSLARNSINFATSSGSP